MKVLLNVSIDHEILLKAKEKIPNMSAFVQQKLKEENEKV